MLQLDSLIEARLFAELAVYIFGLYLFENRTSSFHLRLIVGLRLHITADVFVDLFENGLRHRTLIDTSLFVSV